jgi:hypothetical protein
MTARDVDAARAQLGRGVVLTIRQQRDLVTHVDRMREQLDANMDRLVRAREALDRGDGAAVARELGVDGRA